MYETEKEKGGREEGGGERGKGWRREGNGKHERRGNNRISEIGRAKISSLCVVWGGSRREEKGGERRKEEKAGKVKG